MVVNAPVVPLLENFGEVSVLKGMEEILIVVLTENLEELFLLSKMVVKVAIGLEMTDQWVVLTL